MLEKGEPVRDRCSCDCCGVSESCCGLPLGWYEIRWNAGLGFRGVQLCGSCAWKMFDPCYAITCGVGKHMLRAGEK